MVNFMLCELYLNFFKELVNVQCDHKLQPLWLSALPDRIEFHLSKPYQTKIHKLVSAF